MKTSINFKRKSLKNKRCEFFHVSLQTTSFLSGTCSLRIQLCPKKGITPRFLFFSPKKKPSLKLTAPKNGWLEYFLLSYWVVKRPIYRGVPWLLTSTRGFWAPTEPFFFDPRFTALKLQDLKIEVRDAENPDSRCDGCSNRWEGSMVVSASPKRWDHGIGGIVHPPIDSIYHLLYTTYSPCRTWGVKNATDPTLYRNLKNPLMGLVSLDIQSLPLGSINLHFPMRWSSTLEVYRWDEFISQYKEPIPWKSSRLFRS